MATDKIVETTENLAASFREANRAIVDTTLAAQERNMRYAQSIYTNGIEVLKSHADGTSEVMQTLVEQSRRQQEIWTEIARLSLDVYLQWFTMPFSYTQRVMKEAVEATSR